MTAETINRKVVRTSPARQAIQRLTKKKPAMAALFVFTCFVIIAILAPVIAPYDYKMMDPANSFAAPSLAHPFGCDKYGRDILSRIMIGSGYSLSIGICSVTISHTLGMIFGAIAGFFGQKVDNIIMRIMDVLQSMPHILMAMVISTVLGTGYINTVIAMSFGSIPRSCRVIRGSVLTLRNAEYVEAATSINCSKARIIMHHIIPNCFAPLLVGATMGVGAAISGAAALSFIGLGIQPPNPEWGAMLADGRNYITTHPHVLLFPGLAIAIVVFCLNILGDGLRDALDPKLKR